MVLAGREGGPDARHQADPRRPDDGGARPRDARRRDLARAGARRRRRAPPAGDRGRGPQGRAQPRLRGDRAGQAARRGSAGVRRRGCAKSAIASRPSTRLVKEADAQARGPAARGAEPAAPERAGGPLGRRQRRGAPLGRAAAVRLRAEAALRDRRGPRHPRLRPGEQDRQVALHRDVGRGVAARPGARPAHAGSPHPRARLHRGLGAAPGEPGDHGRRGDAAEVRGADVPDGGARRGPHPLPDPDRGGRADRAARGRDPARGRAAEAVLRVHALLSPRGGHLRPGHQGHDPPAPVRQGRDGEGRRTGPVLRRARVHGARAPRRSCSGSSCRTG